MEPAQIPVAPAVLVVGGTGMLGSDVVRDFQHRGWPVSFPPHLDLNILHAPHIESLRKGDYGDFQWVVNCAAYTQVDKAEEETMAAMALNGIAPGSLAAVCAEKGWRLFHVSTDFVFDGLASEPYSEEAGTHPINVYGKSKLLGETNVMQYDPRSVIVRTAWLYGEHGKCFPRTIVQAWKEGKELRVVADQTGSPTFTKDLARVMGDLIARDVPPGLVHAVGPDQMSWHEFATSAVEAYCIAKGVASEVTIAPIKTSDWPTPAKRPPYSVLSTEKLAGLGISPMRPVAEALLDFAGSLP